MIKEIYVQASEWFIDFRSGDVDAARRMEFDAWARTSPAHLRAYLELAEIWQDSALPAREVSADELIALAAREPDNVVDLASGERRGHVCATAMAATQGGSSMGAVQLARSGRRSAVFSSRLVAVAATVVLAVAAGVLLYGNYYAGLYTTGIGKRRSITLGDGSTILLNAQSRVRALYGSQAQPGAARRPGHIQGFARRSTPVHRT